MFESAAQPDGQQGRVLHGFLDGPRPLFGSYHAPARPVRDIGYVICPPLGWEGIQCYQSVQLLADELAAAGFHTLRVHYDGTGESLGSDEEPGRVAAWLESVRRAVAALAGVRHVERIGLIGMRVGATLAAMVAAELELANLVLWEACVTGAHYSREMEILASAAPSAIQTGRELRPGGIEAGGYLLTHATVAELNALDLLKVKPRGTPDVLLVQRDDRPPSFGRKLAEHLVREGCRATLEQLPGHKEMMTYPERSLPAKVIVARIRDWAVERSTAGEAPAADDARPEGLALAAEAVDGRVRRRPVRFGPSQRLFGVITEPTAAGSARPPVLMLTGGVVPRTGVNRMYVVLASRLAELGHTVLRMDVSGICESAPAEGAAPNDPHAASLLEDVRGAAELLLESTGQSTLTLLGLCSGAYASFQTALVDPRVRGIVLLNPEVFHLEGGSPKFSQTEQSQAAKHYRQSLFSLAAWKKLLSGKANVRYIAGFALAKVKTSAASARDRLSARIKKVPQGLAGDFHRLLARDVKVSVVMAEGDPGHEPLMNQLTADLEALRAMGFTLKLTPGPDHTFNDFSVRQPLVDWLVDVMHEARA
ncbi:MAG TPA: alpha/beta fold hydrolase [Labilithrix sp.]|nr:alpha/beta fold hydrolase [Labilithrix sp.]